MFDEIACNKCEKSYTKNNLTKHKKNTPRKKITKFQQSEFQAAECLPLQSQIEINNKNKDKITNGTEITTRYSLKISEKIDQSYENKHEIVKNEGCSQFEKKIIEKRKNLEIAIKLKNIAEEEYELSFFERNLEYSIYLNEETDLYKIFDEYLISDKDKYAKFVKMCQDDNTLAFLNRYPLKHWIKKNFLIHLHNNEVYILKGKNGFHQMTFDELNSLAHSLVESLYNGLCKNYLH